MNRVMLLLLTTAMCLAISPTSIMADDTVPPDAAWKLVWSDEFDSPGLPDTEKWTYEEGFIRNQELQFYMKDRPENAKVEDGCLVITAKKEQLPNPYHRPGATDWKRERPNIEYTSASLTTRGIAAWKYGRIEVRAKLPTGRGMWPAIWMLGVDRERVGWPACGEIDIMENVGYEPDTIHANIHTKKYNHKIKTNKGAKIEVAKPYETFHVYAVEWFPDHMDFFVDDQKYFTFQNEKTGRDAWPFDQPHYLILNAAIGGSWGGGRGIDDSIFPQRYKIDYVRVYQQQD